MSIGFFSFTLKVAQAGATDQLMPTSTLARGLRYGT